MDDNKKKMKNITLIFFLTIASFSQAQIVNIPDSNFKDALVNDLVVDTDGDEISDDDVDTNNDGEIQQSEANVVLWLRVDNKNISSLEGIQSFTNLKGLSCNSNQLTNIDITQNLNLEWFWCIGNQLTNLDVNQNIELERLDCSNNQLISLDISQNTNLWLLVCFQNQLTSLDLTQNVNILELHCAFNLLESLNIKNGNNTEIFTFYAKNNPNLYCIEVDDPNYSNSVPCVTQISWCKDEWAEYSEDCNLSINELELQQIINIYPNPVKDVLFIENYENIGIQKITIYDILGKVVLIEKNSFNQVDLSVLKNGVLFVNIKTENGILTKKIIKE